MFHTHFNSSNLLWSHKYFVEPQIFCGDNCNSHYDHTCIIPHIYLNSYCGAVDFIHLNSFVLIFIFFHFSATFSTDGYVSVGWIEHESVLARKSFSKVSCLPFCPIFPSSMLLPLFSSSSHLSSPFPHSVLNYQSSVKAIVLHPAQIQLTSPSKTYSRLCLPRNTHPVQHPE